jgi:hypothetical protein
MANNINFYRMVSLKSLQKAEPKGTITKPSAKLLLVILVTSSTQCALCDGQTTYSPRGKVNNSIRRKRSKPTCMTQQATNIISLECFYLCDTY